MEEKKCPCGGELAECMMTHNILPLKPQLSINKKGCAYTIGYVNSYICTSCGRISLYADDNTIKNLQKANDE
ncbi:MAG: hypothetical protein J1E39_06940 [Eubacterium sp.]|nr:hypothetical protein [Eubacterium sp.]